MTLSPLVWQNSLLTFLLSLVFGAVLGVVTFLPLFPSILILLAIVGVGIFFDIIGVAVAAGDEKPLHAMGADRVQGSRQAIWLVRRADRVANICNDVVGDVCNTISGAITASFAVGLAIRLSIHRNIASILAIAVIAALNVGGKALGKVYALDKPQQVILAVGRGLAWLGWTGADRRGRAKRQAAKHARRRR